MGALEREINSRDKELGEASSKSCCLLVLICPVLAQADQCAFGCKKQIGNNFVLLFLGGWFWAIFKTKLEYCIPLSTVWFQVDNNTVYGHASYLMFFDKKYLHEFILSSQDGGFFVTLGWKFTFLQIRVEYLHD